MKTKSLNQMQSYMWMWCAMAAKEPWLYPILMKWMDEDIAIGVLGN